MHETLPRPLTELGRVLRSVLVTIGEYAVWMRWVWLALCVCFVPLIAVSGGPVLPQLVVLAVMAVVQVAYFYGLEALGERLRVTPVDRVRRQYATGEIADADLDDEIEAALERER